MKSLHLVLRTPENVFYESECSSVTVRQDDGYTTFLVGHEDCLGSIIGGVCKFTTESGEERSFVTSVGFYTLKNGTITVNSSLMGFGDDYQKVMDGFSITFQEKRRKYIHARMEYTRSKAEVAKALSGKKEDID